MPYNLDAIRGRVTSMYIRDDGILQIDIDDDALFGLKDAQVVIDTAGNLGNGRKYLNLIVAGKGTLVDEDARILSSSTEGCKYKLADAFVLNSIAQKLIGNFIIKMQKPTVPTAIFTDEVSAVKWLKGLND